MAAPAPVSHRPSSLRLIVGMLLWTTAFCVSLVVFGVPDNPLFAFLWVWFGSIVWNSHRPWRSHLAFIGDWLPFVLFLVLYQWSAQYAGKSSPHVHELIRADVWLFGWATGGVSPPVWLQRELYDPGAVHWWDVAATTVYFSHFVTVLLVAFGLWVFRQQWCGAFVRRWALLSFAGLITYFVYPAAPPWWAAEHGIVDEITRISTRGWHATGLHGAVSALGDAQLDISNPIAAVPSLHSAYALLVVAFFFPKVHKRWIPLLLLYPLAMTFTLVYSGEHWVIDVLVGWAYVGGTFFVCGWAERWWAARRARKPTASTKEPAPIG